MKTAIALLAGFTVLSGNALAAETLPAKNAESRGVRTCLGTIDKFAKFVVEENQHASLDTSNTGSPDTRLFNSQIAVKYPDGNSVALVNVAPLAGGKCDASYTSIWSLDKPCAVVRETSLKDWKFLGDLAGLVVVENQNGSVSQVLLPSGNGNGCTVIKTEVVYHKETGVAK